MPSSLSKETLLNPQLSFSVVLALWLFKGKKHEKVA